jgi:2-C-methyl-D-erythritol 4-phosphate cytidylyltransferase
MNTAIILAAGKGLRMKAEINKQYLLLRGEPILLHTLRAFLKSPLIDEIILVINRDDENICKADILQKYDLTKAIKVVYGGDERQKSVYNGLTAMDKNTEIVLIHDGARPMVTEEIIGRCIDGAEEFGAVSSGVPVKDTVKVLKKDRLVDYTPKRLDVWITQTPQAFKKEIIMKAHKFAMGHGILGTDDAMLVEQMGYGVRMVEGDYKNIKITTPEDLLIAEAIL